MKETRISMGMPTTLEVVDDNAAYAIDAVFAYFESVDQRFSAYRDDSEVAELNRNPLHVPSNDLAEILVLAEQTRVESGGFFNARRPDGYLDPTGIVKGWAIQNAARLLTDLGHEHFCIDVGGDLSFAGKNAEGGEWRVGVRNPFARREIIRTIFPRGRGVATSGSSVRGDHIYNPHNPSEPVREIASITVVGPDILTADRFATAAFAMGEDGVRFVEAIPGCEAYQVGSDGVATMTSGFRALTT